TDKGSRAKIAAPHYRGEYCTPLLVADLADIEAVADRGVSHINPGGRKAGAANELVHADRPLRAAGLVGIGGAQGPHDGGGDRSRAWLRMKPSIGRSANSGRGLGLQAGEYQGVRGGVGPGKR